MKIIKSFLILVALNSELAGQSIWERDKLFIAPDYRVVQTDSVESILYAGLSYKGMPTEVFAYYSNPSIILGKSAENSTFPAVLLIHGGGGTAFKEWVSIWARKGYAAIAIDWRGNGPNGKHLSNGGPEHTAETISLQNESEVKNTWAYQAIGNIILAHSLIRSFAEVDTSKTIITGISWGGYLTCITAGIDERFKAAIPVYGCGFIYKEHVWDASLTTPENLKSKWIEYFDPSSYLSKVKIPMLFVNGTNDPFYPLNIWIDSYRLVKNKTLSLKVRMPHGHLEGWEPNQIYTFADFYAKNGRPFPQIIYNKSEKNFSVANAKPGGSLKAYFNYTTSDNSNWAERRWETVPVKIKGNKVVLPAIKKNATAYYISVLSEKNLWSGEVQTLHAIQDH